MDFEVRKNSQAEVSELVNDKNNAVSMSCGKSPVYATPAMVALMEMAAIHAVDPQLPEGTNTVGIAIDVKHISASPIGMKIRAKATLVAQDRRHLDFKIEAFDEVGLIGTATHERFIIDSVPFLAKAEAKRNK